MKIIFFGKGNRGVVCLKKILECGYDVNMIVGQIHELNEKNTVVAIAKKNNIEHITPSDPNTRAVEDILRKRNADIYILAGYGKILKKNIINIPKLMCINLHGGTLPEYRGSSPMNWMLINGESAFTVSVIRINEGIDTGPILMETTLDIKPTDTIFDLHEKANQVFPNMILRVLNKLKNNKIKEKKQSSIHGSYYPLRFPDDGFILLDQLCAGEVHNRIRALTEPYPCAFTFYHGRKVRLIASMLNEINFFGEPGRVYKKTKKGILVCCADKCIWITKADFEDNKQNLFDVVQKYDKFSTVRGFILQNTKMQNQ